MAIELAAVYVPIIPSLKGSAAAIQKELGLTDTSKVGTKIGSTLGTNIGNGIKSVATGTVGVAAAALGASLVKGMGRLKALDQANQKLLGLGHSADSVKTIMSNALASVRGTAFGMDAAATVAASAVAAGIKPGKDLERTLSLVADAATIAGTDMGSMGGIFNKVAASNKVQMDVINQLHDAGVPALSALADYMGVTAEEASKLASKGKIDFATFQAAMEKALGGAAKSSGDAFSGAMANVGASLGRIGAGILGGVFPKLAPLFQSVTKALGPLEDKASAIGTVIGSKVAPVIDWLTKALSGGLSQLKIAPQIIGPAAAAFVALGSSGLAPLLKMVPGLGGLAARLGFLGGPVGLAVAAFAGLVAVSPELQGALGGLLQAVTTAGAALAPVLSTIAQEFAGGLVAAVTAATPVIVSLVDVIAGLIGWLTDSEGKIRALSVVVGVAAGAWLTYKGVVGAISFVKFIAGLVSTSKAFVLSTVAKTKDIAATVALSAMYAKDFVVSAAKAVAGVVASTASWVANTAAMVASKVALVASKVAMGAATAAQWLFNAALAANPIGLVIAAIAALVAGLVWFFTQTDLGREIWGNFVSFLGEAWTNIVNFVTSAVSGFVGWIQGIGSGFTSWWSGLWSGIGSFFAGLWQRMLDGGRALLMGYVGWLQGVGAAVSSWWSGLWSGIGSFFAGLWSGILDGARSLLAGYVGWIRGIVGGLASWWNSTWASVGSFFSGLWSGIVGAVRSAGSALGAVFNGIRSAVTNAFSGLVSIVKAPINAIIGLVNGAIRGLNRLKVNIPSWVPVFGGSSFGISLPTIPMLADGGTVKPRPGGTLALLAEAGKAESVVDTGLLNRALAEGLSGNGQDGMTVQGPLVQVDQMVVDSDARVDEVAQELFERGQRAARAGGGVNLGGAVVV
ncbi:tape measure protein [Microbacterium sp.]|uniref:tape measure protein n=1 Tax=Microbacterium sp. TaxID=51671 RepID=UPI003A8DB440